MRVSLGTKVCITTSPLFPVTYHKLTGDNHERGGAAGDATQPSEEPPRMIGDFDDNANPLWSLQMKEALSHDEARIYSLKDDMNGFLIFVRVHNSVVISYLADAWSSRLVYSQLFSFPLSSIRSMIFKSILHSRWSTISNRMLPYSPRSLSRSPLSPLRCPSHPLHLHHIPTSLQTRLMSGSTHTGS